MASTTHVWTVADLLRHFGPIPASRVRHDPPPGTATEKDVTELEAREGRLYELIDGVLVEKTMGYYESYLAALIVRWLGDYAEKHNLGIVTGADGASRLLPEQVRIPDAALVRWDRLPGRRLPPQAIPPLCPDLAVEILSEGNTPEEMERKLVEYFRAGVQVVWYVDPTRRSVRVYTGPDRPITLTEEHTLDGGDRPAGFRLPLRQLFAAQPE
jgi:Uma2 family endonuclease